MKVQHNVQLKDKTTFMVSAIAETYIELGGVEDVDGLISSNLLSRNKYFILGGGSNVLFTKDFKGVIIAPKLLGKEVIKETESYQEIKVAAGESWHDFVLHARDQGLWGIENLVLIPGTVGSSAVQNIGAYGVEAQETITQVHAINLLTGDKKSFSREECNFSYRMSFFKSHPEWLITSVSFKLQKQGKPVVQYGSVLATLKERGIENPSVRDITEVITDIRRSKLPDVGALGMAGSFFKNPVIDKQKLVYIQKHHPEVPYYELENNRIKIPAAWVIETLGYKGISAKKNVGTYHKHALVIAHNGTATGKEVHEFIQLLIQKSIDEFSILLEPEVIIL